MQIEGDWGFRLRNAPRRGLARIRRTSGFFMSAVVNFSSTLNEPAGVLTLASQGWGVGNRWSLSAQDRWSWLTRKKMELIQKATLVSEAARVLERRGGGQVNPCRWEPPGL